MRLPLRLLVAPLATLVLAFPATAWAQRAPLAPKDIRLDQLARDTQHTDIGDDTLELVWLIPQRYWEASAAQQPSLSDEDRKHFLSQLDGYLLFATVRGKVGIAGIDQFASAEAVRDGLRIVDVAGMSHAPLAPEQIPAPLKNLLSVLRPVMANMIGPMGDNMHFVVFASRDAKGRPVFDPLSEGRIQVITSRRAYPFRTPLGSVLPPRLDASTGESFPGDYHYNPYTGDVLKDVAQPH